MLQVDEIYSDGPTQKFNMRCFSEQFSANVFFLNSDFTNAMEAFICPWPKEPFYRAHRDHAPELIRPGMESQGTETNDGNIQTKHIFRMASYRNVNKQEEIQQ